MAATNPRLAYAYPTGTDIDDTAVHALTAYNMQVSEHVLTAKRCRLNRRTERDCLLSHGTVRPPLQPDKFHFILLKQSSYSPTLQPNFIRYVMVVFFFTTLLQEKQFHVSTLFSTFISASSYSRYHTSISVPS
jgi:hypothetical protein